jgi:hypothetical protein
VYLIDDEQNDDCYGFIPVVIQADASWLHLKSLIAGRVIPNIGIVLKVRYILVGKEKVDNDSLVRDKAGQIRAVVILSMLCVAC